MAEEYYAFTELDKAIRSTRDLLWPFKKGVWLRIALIALFVGWGGGFPQTTWSSDNDIPGDIFEGFSPSFLPDNLGIILAFIIGILILFFIFMLIGSILQFVFVDCVRTKNVTISLNFRPRAEKGLRLFLFEIGISFLLILVLLAAFIPLLIASGGIGGGLSLVPTTLSLLLLIPIIIIAAVIAGIIQLITIDFVVPIMIRKDCGVIEGWKSIYHIIRTQWMQGIIYVIVRFLAALGAGITIIIITLLALGILAIPFAIIGFILYATVLMMNYSLLLLLLIPYLILAIPAALLISVPFITFFRTYSLKVLGRLSPEYAMLPEVQHESG